MHQKFYGPEDEMSILDQVLFEYEQNFDVNMLECKGIKKSVIVIATIVLVFILSFLD